MYNNYSENKHKGGIYVPPKLCSYFTFRREVENECH